MLIYVVFAAQKIIRTDEDISPKVINSFYKSGKEFFWVSTMCTQILGFSRVRVRVSIRVSLV